MIFLETMGDDGISEKHTPRNAEVEVEGNQMFLTQLGFFIYIAIYLDRIL